MLLAPEPVSPSRGQLFNELLNVCSSEGQLWTSGVQDDRANALRLGWSFAPPPVQLVASFLGQVTTRFRELPPCWAGSSF